MAKRSVYRSCSQAAAVTIIALAIVASRCNPTYAWPDNDPAQPAVEVLSAIPFISGLFKVSSSAGAVEARCSQQGCVETDCPAGCCAVDVDISNGTCWLDKGCFVCGLPACAGQGNQVFTFTLGFPNSECGADFSFQPENELSCVNFCQSECDSSSANGKCDKACCVAPELQNQLTEQQVEIARLQATIETMAVRMELLEEVAEVRIEFLQRVCVEDIHRRAGPVESEDAGFVIEDFFLSHLARVRFVRFPKFQ